MGPFILFPPYTPNALFSARIIRSQHSFIACCRLRILHIRFCVYLLTISTAFMKLIAKFTILILYTNNNPFSRAPGQTHTYASHFRSFRWALLVAVIMCAYWLIDMHAFS
jgi:hypothetical protein